MNTSVSHLIAQARERFALQDYYGAVHMLNDVLDLGHQFADVHHLMGLCLSMLGQHEQALEAFDKALELNPEYLEAHIHRGLVLNEVGRVDEAHDAFARAAGADETTPSGFPAHIAGRLANDHASLGRAYAEAGGLEEAIDQYRRAVALGPGFSDLRYRLARLLLDSGQSLAAREELERVVKERPAFVDALAALGLACYLSGDAGGAEEVWQECLARRPENARVEAYLAMMSRAAE